jgi:agmatine deiminase
MAWPLEADYWQGRAEQAREEWAGVARAVAAAEPVIMVCNPGDEQSVLRHCGSAVEVLPIPIDDSWMRDSGPIFVRNDAGEVSAVSFRFNAWGERFPSWANDDAMPAAVAAHLGVRLFEAPFVLEGGSILTDGERTLLTTEMCLLSSNRNPGMTKDEIERGLHEYLGVDTVVWLPYGMAGDVGPVATDGTSMALPPTSSPAASRCWFRTTRTTKIMTSAKRTSPRWAMRSTRTGGRSRSSGWSAPTAGTRMRTATSPTGSSWRR